MKAHWILLAVLFIALALSPWLQRRSAPHIDPLQTVPAQPGAPVNAALQVSRAMADAVDKVLPSVVVIKTTATQRYLDFWRGREILRDEPVGQGSGVIIDKEGYILTNNHVLQGAQRVTVMLNDGTELPAKFIGSNQQTDMAVLKIDPQGGKKFIAVEIADSEKTRVGEICLAIGSPFSLNSTVTQGIISYKGRGADILPVVDFLQTSAPINPGNSGGALVDVRGRLIGINTFIQTAGPYAQGNIGIGFAVPSNLAMRIAELIIKGEKADLPWIGVVMREFREGLVVMNLIEDGPAESSGLKEKDLITRVEGKSVRTTEELQTLVKLYKPGQVLNVEVLRGGEKIDVRVKTEPMPKLQPRLR